MNRKKWIKGLSDNKVAVELIKSTSQQNRLLREKKHKRGTKRRYIEEKIFHTKSRQDDLARAVRDRNINVGKAITENPREFLPFMDALGKREQNKLKKLLGR